VADPDTSFCTLLISFVLPTGKSGFGMCQNVSEVDPRSPSEIQEVLDSHHWESKSANKSPWGIISRFACTICGDEFVAMLTSKNIVEESAILEVSAESVILM
jgi:hypothetical protein